MFLDLSQFDVKGLDLVFETQEEICDNLLHDIRREGKSDSESHKENLRRLGYFLYELKHISDEIDKRRQEKLIYSIQDIYKFAGQFDKFVSFSFYRTSDAYRKYGNDAYGHLIYQRDKRNELEVSISNKNYERTDDKVFLKGVSDDKTKNSMLEAEGFLASDVFEMLSFDNYTSDKQYKKEGQKVIPNTIEIKFDNTDCADSVDTKVWIASYKLQNGYTLLRHEYVEFYANLFALNPQLVSQEDREKYLLDTDKKTLTKDVSIEILTAKGRKKIVADEELFALNQLLKERKLQRLKVVEKELGISKKQLDKFRELYPNNYKELNVVLTNFETETLSQYKTQYPIYWDYERFIHIYLGHYKNFFIKQSEPNKTPFQYSYRDIRRLACLIIEQLRSDIETRLSQGKSYGKWGDKGFYFNGNYYQIRIDSTGKLMQFHPLEYDKLEKTENP